MMQAQARIARRLSILMPLLFVVGVLPVHGASSSAYEPQSDPQGDPMPFGMPTPGAASTPVSAPYDLVEFGITDEDELGFNVYLKVVNLKGDPTQTPFISSSAFYDVWWTLEGSKASYSLSWFESLPDATQNPTGVHVTYPRFCVWMETTQDSPGGDFVFLDCYAQRVTGTIDFDQSTLSAYITKDAMMGRAPLDSGVSISNPPVLTKNSRLGEIYARATRNFPTFLQDRLPDSEYAKPYVFGFDAANNKLRMSLDTGRASAGLNGTVAEEPDAPTPDETTLSNRVSVTPGVPTLVSLRVENLNTAKRLVNLSAEVLQGSGSDKFSLQIAPAIRVPAGDSRVVNLIVNASAKAAHREEAVAVVKGRSLGVADEMGAIRLELVASVPPAPERKTLYFHAAPWDDPDVLSTALCTAIPCGADRGWLNTLDSDPLATKDAGVRVPLNNIGGSGSFAPGYGMAFVLDTPLANALVLDPTKPIEVKLAFRSNVEFPARVDFELMTLETGRLVATGSADSTIRGGSPVTLSALPMPDAARIEPADGELVALLDVRPPLTGPGATAVAGFDLIPAESEMVLPLVPDPNARNVKLSAGPAFITLTAETDATDFVNAGEGALYNLTVVNEGIEADDARLEILYDNPEWRVDLYPGSRFHLEPGDGAKFSILVRAPENATENEALHILVNATSVSDPSAQSQLRLTTIVVGLDLEDESGYYALDVESSEKVVKREGSNTPGFEVFLVAAAALGVGLARRRKA